MRALHGNKASEGALIETVQWRFHEAAKETIRLYVSGFETLRCHLRVSKWSVPCSRVLLRKTCLILPTKASGMNGF
jgi:hypothetical protein